MAGPLPVGALQDIGVVPERMYAQVIRSDRLGEPAQAFRIEEVDTPRIGPDEVLVAVMAAGVNFNNVWAARGVPIDVIASRARGGDPLDYHVGGSDAAGIVYAVGSDVRDVRVGQQVLTHPGHWDASDPWMAAGGDPMLAPSSRIWGYDTNHGAFAQFAVVQAHQCLAKPAQLSWEEAAAAPLVGTTAYRMLFGWEGNRAEEGDVVLVWGGSGGLGSQAIQLARHAGALPVAVVSSPDRGAFCERLGAVGFIDRTEFDHWGVPPHWTDREGQKRWTAGARAFGKRIGEIVGARRDPAIVFEHPGEATIPTSVFVCAPGGMVVICAGSSGYSAMVDLRYHWTRQKRLQGSHGTNDQQAREWAALLRTGAIDPVVGDVRPFEDVGHVHSDMARGTLPPGNTTILVGAAEPGFGRRSG
ncbi:MAG: crotonyl-CoA carboxylase/reductase [Solirubrobacteraceae bacterium]